MKVGWQAARKLATHEVSTVGVHLSSPITTENVDLGLVEETNSLDIVRGHRPLNTGKGACRDETSAVPGLGAVGNHDTFNVANFFTVLRGTPEAEVYTNPAKGDRSSKFRVKNRRRALLTVD
jgi:hypothetical protein